MKFLLYLLLMIMVLLSACAGPTAPPPAPAPSQDSAAEAAPSATTHPLLEDSSTATPHRPTATPAVFKSPTPTPTDPAAALAFERAAALGRGINLGNALEAPKEGDWGVTLQAGYFKLIQEQGFQTVRVPMRWSAYAQAAPPYTIDPSFFKRIDWVLEQAAQNNLNVILNLHHYDEFMNDPAGQRERYLALWEQIAAHYAQAPATVYFELLNEPDNRIDPGFLNDLFAEVIPLVRATNPDRTLIVGPVWWNAVDHLNELKLPEEERNLIVTFHYYWPMEFTHQGTEWMSGSDQWLGMDWGSKDDENQLAGHLELASQWGKRNNRPIFLGEFGVYHKADMAARTRWTSFVARTAEEKGMAWAYWDFCAGFGIYDLSTGAFQPDLVKALIP